MRVQVRAVGGDNDIPASGLDAYALQTLRMASDLVHRYAGGELVNAIVKFDAIGKYLAHHCQHVTFAERDSQHLVAHASTGGVGHFGILNVIARVRKQVVVAGVIPVHVGGDDVIDLVGLQAACLYAIAHRVGDLPCAFLRSDLIEACVAYKDAVRPLNNPDVVGNRRHLVVGIAEDIILGTLARVSPITDSVDFVDVVAHAFFSEPTTTPARRSIILTIAVKSASPPNSELVVSH